MTHLSGTLWSPRAAAARPIIIRSSSASIIGVVGEQCEGNMEEKEEQFKLSFGVTRS